MGHDSTISILLADGADLIPPRDLFRNIWDPDELSKLVQTFEKSIENMRRRYRGNFSHLALLRPAAAQFEKMGQRNSAEEMNRRATTLRALLENRGAFQ